MDNMQEFAGYLPEPVLAPHGRIFRALGVEPYTRKAGSEIFLMVWEARCVRCGDFFRVKTAETARRYVDDKNFGFVRCEPCRKANRLAKEPKAASGGHSALPSRAGKAQKLTTG